MFDTITDVPGIRVGHDTDLEGGTGCTVILCETPAVGGVDVRGGAPATRETDLLRATNMMQEVHAILLTGGSAFGLSAADGVMRYLEEQEIGYDVGVARVPIVPAAAIFDLGCGSASVRPNAESGYRACQQAVTGEIAQGTVGAGTGATFAKMINPFQALKGGIGSASAQLPDGTHIGALVVVNALGHIWNEKGQEWYGGMPPTVQIGAKMSNTTIAVIATNAALSKAGINRVAQMAHDGLAQVIRPAHTMFDGDAIFALSLPAAGVQVQETAIQISFLGAIAAELMARAILKAVNQASALHGIPVAQS